MSGPYRKYVSSTSNYSGAIGSSYYVTKSNGRNSQPKQPISIPKQPISIPKPACPVGPLGGGPFSQYPNNM